MYGMLYIILNANYVKHALVYLFNEQALRS